jgi:phosphoenolpyruvate-protein phosphotransferase
MKTLRGIGASPGTAMGPAFLFRQEDLSFKAYEVAEPQAEWKRMEIAFQIASAQLKLIYEKALKEVGESQAAIFEAHIQMLEDPELIDSIRKSILEGHNNAEKALLDAAEYYARTLDGLADEYFRARATDVRDVAHRCLRILLGKPQVDVALNKPSIIVGRDLSPSDTARMDKSMLLGFCTAEGGATSHTSILAKALGVPAVVGVSDIVLTLAEGVSLIINGRMGEIVVSPDEATVATFVQNQKSEKERAAVELAAVDQPAITVDGRMIEVVANVGSVADAEKAVTFGADGIGLLRTEFLYLDRQTAPNEDEQYAVYKTIFDIQGSRPVVIRTIDVGGDKELAYIDLGHENNPFLGWRAIRMCLDNPNFFKTQLRAILRAALGHDIRIMFPMIATVNEVTQARNFLDEARAELEAAGNPFGKKIQVGIMVEIPAAAVMADKFVEVVDFFSIGTNDLTQYTMAAERTNKKVAHLSNALEPAVLRLIAKVIEEGHKGGVWVGMCGELAGEPKAIPILLGLGLDEFSMAPTLIPYAKAVIRATDVTSCQKIAKKVLDMQSYFEVDAYLSKLLLDCSLEFQTASG